MEFENSRGESQRRKKKTCWMTYSLKVLSLFPAFSTAVTKTIFSFFLKEAQCRLHLHVFVHYVSCFLFLQVCISNDSNSSRLFTITIYSIFLRESFERVFLCCPICFFPFVNFLNPHNNLNS